MKKLITAAVALSMTVSAFAPRVFADDGLDKIVSEVKARAGITDEYTDFSSDYSEETNGYTEYYFSWTSEDDEKNVSVTYNSDGVITSYRKSHENENGKGLSLPKISSEDAKKAAREFIDKLNPAAEYIVNDTNTGSALNGDYSFGVERLKNNIPVNDFYGNITVDRDTADVYSMWTSYVPVDEFEDISPVISQEDARSAFKEKLGMELVYGMYYDSEKRVVFPTYQQKSADKYISAVTGEVYEPALNAQLYRNTAESVSSDATSAKETGGGLSPVEIKELDKIAGLISKADIEAKVRADSTLNIPSDLTLKNINLQRDSYDDTQYIYSMSFEGDKVYASVSADAKTGEIKSFIFNDWSGVLEENAEETDESKVKAAAEEVFNSLAGGKKSEYRFDKVFGNTALYIRYVNGIKVKNDTISISVDNGGRLTSYYLRYTADAEFPSLDGAISADEAADKLFEAVNYDINYYIITDKDGKTAAKALYMFDTTGFINPFTGKLVNYRNEEAADSGNIYSYSDIDGHYAKARIETLASYGVGFEGGEYKPDEKITQRDFLYLLLNASYSYNDFGDNDELYRVARREGLIDERDDNAEVTRGDMAKMMIRFMDAEEFAKYDEIYVSPFKDVTENKGYTAILSAMGVVKGDENGNFNPQNSMTRAEAACVIYNYLNR